MLSEREGVGDRPALLLSSLQPVRDVNVNTNGKRTDNILVPC